MKWRHLTFPILVYSLALYSLLLLFGSAFQWTAIAFTAQVPTLLVQGSILGKCCRSVLGGEDICGRANCSWTCDTDLLKHAKFADSLGNEAFFHETSGSGTLNYRQACSVESLARLNPELSINVLMTSQEEVNITSAVGPMRALRNYANVKFSVVKLSDYFLLTPLEHWYFCTDWNYGRYAVSHLSDALRFLTLYKYGGYYFDLDFVMIRPVTDRRNFTAAESSDFVAAGALHFDYRHPVILDAINEFRTTYRRDEWNHNGPGVLTRVLLKHCNAENVTQLQAADTCRCKFSVLAPATFYPIHYDNWTHYFNDDSTTDVLPHWAESGVIGAHVWNKLSAGAQVVKNSSQLYSRLSRSFCPRVFSSAPDVF